MTPGQRRAKQLELNPRPPQNNAFKHFHYPVSASDMDIVERNRIVMCVDIRHKNKK
jgi:hypothetical protein